MKPVVLLGAAGTIGRVIAWDWLRFSREHKIILADRDAVKLASLARELGSRSRFISVDLENTRKLVSTLRQGALVINSTSHHFNLPVMRAALDARCHYLDMGGLFHFTRRQLKLHGLFHDAGLTAILGMGCAPGLTNLMARELTVTWEKVESIDVRIAGVNHHPDSGAFPYAFRTLWEELTLKPALFHRGKWFHVPAQSGRETYFFPQPVGAKNLFYTLHSEVASLPLFFKSRGIRHVSFRIGLDLDLCRRVLKKEMPSPEKTSFPGVLPEDEEMALIEARGTCHGQPVQGRMICETRSEGKWSAGDLNTACPASATAALFLGKNHFPSGVYPPENAVPWLPLQQSLLKRGFHFIQETALSTPSKH